MMVTQQGQRVWLDDLKPAPPGWEWVRSANEAIARLAAGPVQFLSLDHDLGGFADDGGDGTAVTDWLADPETNRWPSGGVRVHSENPIGRSAMLATVDTYSPYPLGWGSHRGEAPATGWPIALAR